MSDTTRKVCNEVRFGRNLEDQVAGLDAENDALRTERDDLRTVLADSANRHSITRIERNAALCSARECREVLGEVLRVTGANDVGNRFLAMPADLRARATALLAGREGECGGCHDWRLVGETDEMPSGARYRCHRCHATVDLPSNITGSPYALATWLDKQAGPCKAASPAPQGDGEKGKQ